MALIICSLSNAMPCDLATPIPMGGSCSITVTYMGVSSRILIGFVQESMIAPVEHTPNLIVAWPR